MKKLALLIISIILFSLCAVPAVAAEYNEPGEQELGLFAKAVYTLPDGCYSAEDDNGDSVVKLPDGTEITVTPKAADPSLRLVIYPITEKDTQVYQWFSNHTANLGTNPLFYDIYFIDEYGTRVDISTTATVTITLPKGYGIPKVAALSAAGAITQSDSKVRDNIVFFTIEKSGYYVVAATPSDNSGAGTPVSPQTGDNSNMRLWIILLLVSGTGMVGTTFCCKIREVRR